ncbi:MAG: ferritin-like domain-containing protein [Abitibacteriaceae bacterium]|nr:ferritin-like domain-containing protein [Abditibacteriaceae bacterium]
MALKSLEDALVDELQDLLSAETQLTQALPKLAEKATHPELKAAFQEHLEQTKGHVERLNQAFKLLGKSPESKTCEAMKGLIKEGQSVMEEDAAPNVMDAFLIAAAQKVEHYEIASYGTVCTWAETIGNEELADLLGETLDEEEETDDKLTELAEDVINEEAA